jgi:hypothetical protein
MLFSLWSTCNQSFKYFNLSTSGKILKFGNIYATNTQGTAYLLNDKAQLSNQGFYVLLIMSSQWIYFEGKGVILEWKTLSKAMFLQQRIL